MQGLSCIYRTIRTASVSLESVYSILHAENTLGDALDAIELPRVRGDVIFEHVHFH